MAVSQYLRHGNLIDMVKSYLTPEVTQNASSLVGESESSTRQALNGAVPTLLGGLTNMASSHEGASSITNMIRDGGYGATVDNASSLFSGGSSTSNMLNVGQQLIGKIFGSKGSSVSDAIASSSGIKPSSAASLMALAAPLALGALGKHAAAQGVGAAGVPDMLLNEKKEIAAAVPSGVSRIFGFGGPQPATFDSTRSTPVRYEQEAVSKTRSWLPLLLVALGLLALLLFLRGRSAREAANVARQGAATAQGAVEQGTAAVTGAIANITLPGGGSISVPEGSMTFNLAHFLGDTSATDLPKTFVFDHLNFDSATANLTPDSTQTVAGLAATLNAYPNAHVQLTGHTDNTGTPEANQQLSLDRANAVKTMLVNDGVAADRITTSGMGQEHPIAPNDTEEGKAKNRRLELVVVSK